MWYNISAEKNGKSERIQETAANFPVEEMEKSFLVVKKSEIVSNLLTVFCKALKTDGEKVKLGK